MLTNPSMSRAHFQLVADVIRARVRLHGARPLRVSTLQELTKDFADAFAATNPRFNRRRFIEACGFNDDDYMTLRV